MSGYLGIPARELERIAREENETDWEPLPGMVKLRCERCSYWHASYDEDARYCMDCTLYLRAYRRKHG